MTSQKGVSKNSRLFVKLSIKCRNKNVTINRTGRYNYHLNCQTYEPKMVVLGL